MRTSSGRCATAVPSSNCTEVIAQYTDSQVYRARWWIDAACEAVGSGEEDVDIVIGFQGGMADLGEEAVFMVICTAVDRWASSDCDAKIASEQSRISTAGMNDEPAYIRLGSASGTDSKRGVHAGGKQNAQVPGQSQPASVEIRTASTRLRAPSLVTADAR